MSEETSPAPVPESVPDFRSESEPAPGSGSTPTDDPSGPRGPFLSWPPPGLEPIQGRLTGTNALLFLGAIVLVLPLLVSIGTEQSFTSLGVFGSAGWIVAVTTVCGLVLLAEGFRRFFTPSCEPVTGPSSRGMVGSPSCRSRPTAPATPVSFSRAPGSMRA